jgi:hypothetical protein
MIVATRLFGLASVGALGLAAPVPCSTAQQRPVAPPEEVARAVLRADSAGDWTTLLQLSHPEALIRFRAFQTWQLRFLRGGWPPPDTLADTTAQGRWRDARARKERFMLDSVFQVPDVDSLAHTSPDSVFARWFRAVGTTRAADSGAAAQPQVARVVGSVKASDTLAYVVVERPVEQPLGPLPEMFRDFPSEPYRAEVMVMRRHGREWRSMLDRVGEMTVLSADLGPDE